MLNYLELLFQTLIHEDKLQKSDNRYDDDLRVNCYSGSKLKSC